MLTFTEYVAKYANKKNPATGKVWQLADIEADSGIGDYILANGGQTLIAEWFGIVLNKSIDTWNTEGRGPTDDELIAAYEAVHPNKTLVKTPMGLLYVDKQAPERVKLGDMFYEDFIIRFMADLKKG